MVSSLSKKIRCRVFLAADWNFAYGNMQLFHGQASSGEANYNIGNYYFYVDDHTSYAIK
jgi:hypothetical protein